MKRKTSHLKAGALCLLTLTGAAALPTNVMAENITLRSQDGTIDITGEFLEFSDNIYLVRTALGELRLSAERVRCEGTACPAFEATVADVTFAGSEAIGVGVLPIVLEGYAGYLDAEATVVATERQNEVIAKFVGESGFGDAMGSYLVNSTSSTAAFEALMGQDAELGMTSRRIKPVEARALRDAGAGNMISPDQEHIIGVDSLVVVTHPDNPVNELTVEQLASIYSGAIKNWSDVGGPDQQITVIDRPEGSGTRDVLANLFNQTITTTASTADRQIAVDNGEASTLVRENEAAIGFVGYAFLRGTKPVSLINECGMKMIPDAFSSRTEEYSLQRRLYMYNRADVESEATQEFLQFVKSSDADPLIQKAGFIDLGVDRQSQDLESERARMLLEPGVDSYESGYMQQMLADMVNFDRLSTTFRFRTGSSRLDERARVDMERLVSYLEARPEGATLRIVGFTDSVGAFDSNLNLAQNRAAQVRAEFTEFAGDRLNGVNIEVASYGEIAPTACNVSDQGRAINRRVEVWIEAAG